MTPVSFQLSNYAKYHRDPRNINTHFVGIPLIVVAICALLSKPSFNLFELPLTPALLVTIVTCLYYLKLHLVLGIIMTVALTLCLSLGGFFAAMPMNDWLSWGIGLFVVGWILQFIGHYYEGKKPAFFDDIKGLIIGPLFVVSEVLFKLGMLKDIERDVIANAGPITLHT